MELETKDYGLKDFQDKCLGILEFLESVCRKNGFTYYLAYGTLLGAIRQKGIIP